MLDSFVVSACDGSFMSKTANLRIVADGSRLLVPMRDLLARCFTDLGFFLVICRKGVDRVVAYVAFRRIQDFYWSYIDLDDPSFLFRWRTGDLIGLADKRVHNRKRQVDGHFVYHEYRLPSIAVCFQADVRLTSLDDGVVANGEEFGDERPDPSSAGIFMLAPTATGDDKGDSYIRDMPSGPSPGREQRCTILSNTPAWSIVWGCLPLTMDWVYCHSQSAACVTTLNSSNSSGCLKASRLTPNQ